MKGRERGIGIIKVNPTAKKTHGDFIEFHSFIHSSNAPAQDLFFEKGRQFMENESWRMSFLFFSHSQTRQRSIYKKTKAKFRLGFPELTKYLFHVMALPHTREINW